MMKRNRLAVQISWLLLDAEHAQYNSVIGLLRGVHKKRPDLALSVNARHDGSQALVKLLGPMPALPAGVILRVYTDADHSDDLALVGTYATDLDPSAGWQKPRVAEPV